MAKKISKKSKIAKKTDPNRFHFKPIDWACFIIGIAASTLTIFFDHDHSLAYIIASLIAVNCGVTEVILGINGRRINYIFAMLNAIAFIFISWVDQFYGNLAINIYYVPICIIGFYLWSKHSDKKKDVIARKLSVKQLLFAALIFAISFVLLNSLLLYLDGHSTILDSATTILIVFASILGVLRYREQWLVWIIADTMMLVMWVPVGNPAVIALRIFYVVSSVYGYINWRKFIQKPF